MADKISNITAIILCGGRSQRMGQDKGLLKLGHITAVEHIYNLLSSVFNNVLFSVNNPDSYKFLDVTVVKDKFMNVGPIGGIHAALEMSSNEKNLVVSCDMPFISEEAIRFICNCSTEKQIVLPRAEGRTQYLFGVYRKSILPQVEKTLTGHEAIAREQKNINFSMKKIISEFKVEFVDVENKSFYNQDLFFNMNTQEDYDYAMRKLMKKNFKDGPNDI